MTDHEKRLFREVLWAYYHAHGRHDLPWREPEPDGSFDPYKIMVSELLLQQTQVSRVIPKYREFLRQFPTVAALARAELGDVLRTWQGLGYNRRAKYLHEAAKLVYNLKHFPDTREELVRLPGIGVGTAGAILAYAYNQPALFVETNVRTVFLYHFFPERTDVSDREILDLLEQVLLEEAGDERPEPSALPQPSGMKKTARSSHYREFYWALMDYGSHLKVTVGNANKASKHYTKQSRFDGSRRQVRGQVIRLLGGGSKTLPQLHGLVSDERLESVLGDLVAEGLIREQGSTYAL